MTSGFEVVHTQPDGVVVRFDTRDEVATYINAEFAAESGIDFIPPRLEGWPQPDPYRLPSSKLVDIFHGSMTVCVSTPIDWVEGVAPVLGLPSSGLKSVKVFRTLGLLNRIVLDVIPPGNLESRRLRLHRLRRG